MDPRTQSRNHRIVKIALAWLVGVLLIAVLPASAEEIVFFTNGTSMPIKEHVVRGAMVHVDLGSDGFIAFPAAMILRIERAGERVILEASAFSQTTGRSR